MIFTYVFPGSLEPGWERPKAERTTKEFEIEGCAREGIPHREGEEVDLPDLE